MAFIYLISNTINNKVYVGKTEHSIQKRFAEHKADSTRRRNEKRPLYSAMRKYGTDKFNIQLLKETNSPEEDEIKLIKKYDSYKNGYNATLGGDGKKYLDIDVSSIVQEYQSSLKTTVEFLAKKYSVCIDSIRKILRDAGVTIRHSSAYSGKLVQQIDKLTGEVINTFASTAIAAKALNMSSGAHIRKCATGNRKTAGGFCWKYV